MEYLTVQQTAEKWNVTPRWVQALIKQNRIGGVIRFSNIWMIPKDAEKPRDTRGDWHRKPKTNDGADPHSPQNGDTKQ